VGIQEYSSDLALLVQSKKAIFRCLLAFSAPGIQTAGRELLLKCVLMACPIMGDTFLIIGGTEITSFVLECLIMAAVFASM
jgi:hypothetical protein